MPHATWQLTVTLSFFLSFFFKKKLVLTVYSGEKWKNYISAMCLADPTHNKSEFVKEAEIDINIGLEKGSFARFLSTRCHAYILSPHPVEWPVAGTLQYGCNTFSSGEPVYAETSIVSCWKSMLQWLDKLHAEPSYEEVELIIAEEPHDDEWEKWKEQAETESVDAVSSG